MDYKEVRRRVLQVLILLIYGFLQYNLPELEVIFSIIFGTIHDILERETESTHSKDKQKKI